MLMYKTSIKSHLNILFITLCNLVLIVDTMTADFHLRLFRSDTEVKLFVFIACLIRQNSTVKIYYNFIK